MPRARVAVVHNGIIENFKPLRRELARDADGRFESQTDTEVVVHLLAEQVEAGQITCRMQSRPCCPGSRAPSRSPSLFRDHDDLMIGARLGSPLVVGRGEGEDEGDAYLGSDALALAPLTRRIAYLKEGDRVIVRRGDIRIFDVDDASRWTREFVDSGVTAGAIEKGEYRHFMLKEIFEQPTVVAQTLGSAIFARWKTWWRCPIFSSTFRRSSRVTIVACGTSFYAGMVAKYWFEQFARVPVDIDVASEFRYREPIMEEGRARALHQPVRRDRRHARRAAPRPRRGAEDRRCRQRAHQHHGARGGPACYPPMPGRRSALPRPRRSRASSPSLPRSRRISPG